MPAAQTTWARWKQEHPGTLVLSFQTAYRRNYSRDPYQERSQDRRLALVVALDGKAKLYPFSELKKAAAPLADEIAGKRVSIAFDRRDETAAVRGPEGTPVPHFVAFLADARAFYPDAPVFKAR